MSPKALLRLAAAACLALPLIPLQMAAVRLDWPLAARLPVPFHRCLLRILGVRVVERGAMDRRRPLLVVANHVSWLDIPVLGARAPLSFIAKSEVGTWPVISLFARLQRSVFIDRTRRHKTGEATARIGARLAAGDAMLLFAEGTTGDGIRVLPFRSALIGAAREAVGGDKEASFIQPLAIRYLARDGLPIARAAMPAISWAGDTDLAPHLLAVLAGGPIDVAVSWGESIAVDRHADRKALARDLQAGVRALMRS